MSKYLYSVRVYLRDSFDHHRVISEKFYFFKSMLDLQLFIDVCKKLNWEVLDITQEVEI